MPEIIGIPLNILAPSALLGLCVLLILTGRLVPRRTYDDKAHEAAEWRTEARLNQQTIVELTEQNAKMLNAFGPTLTDFLRSLRRVGVEARDDEGNQA